MAVSITGDSNTYLQSRQDEDKNKIVGAYEYLNFSVQDAGNITFHVGGWVSYDLGDKQNSLETKTLEKILGDRGNSDLQYGFLSYKSANSNAMVNLGRIMVSEGVAAARVDGIYVRTDLVHNFGISVFGGRSVDSDISTVKGDNTIIGTRLTHQVPGLYKFGVSAMVEKKNGEESPKEEGFDFWFRPMNNVEFVGNSKYSAVQNEWKKLDIQTSDWANHSYSLVLGPVDKMRLTTEASMINYKNFFTAPTTSAFRFDPTVIDPNEKVRILGEEVAYDLSPTLNFSISVKDFKYDIAGKATSIGGNLRLGAASTGRYGFSVRNMSGDEDRLKYMEFRAFALRKVGHADFLLDVLDVKYSEAINGVRDAYTLLFSAGYELSERMKITADAELSRNPDFDKDIRTMAKLEYRFDTAHGAHGAAAEQSKPKEGN
jgi:hypothetical protein